MGRLSTCGIPSQFWSSHRTSSWRLHPPSRSCQRTHLFCQSSQGPYDDVVRISAGLYLFGGFKVSICFKGFLLANATAFGLNLLSYFSLKIDQYLSRNIPEDTTASSSNSMTTDFFPSKVASRLPRKSHTLTPKNGVPCNSCAGKPQKSRVIYMECQKHSCAGKFRFSGWSMEVGSEKWVPKQM